MKKYYPVIISIILLSIQGYSQTVTFEYKYDAAGNRVKRTIIDMSYTPPPVNNDSIPGENLIEEEFAYNENYKYLTDNIDSNHEDDPHTGERIYEDSDFDPDIPQELKIKHNDLNINLYPNPVKERLFIEITGDYDIHNVSCELIDANGRIINNKILDSSRDYIDFSTVLPGMYVLRIFINSDHREYKVIKN